MIIFWMYVVTLLGVTKWTEASSDENGVFWLAELVMQDVHISLWQMQVFGKQNKKNQQSTSQETTSVTQESRRFNFDMTAYTL